MEISSIRKCGKLSLEIWKFPYRNTGNIHGNLEISTWKYSWKARAAPPGAPRCFGALLLREIKEKIPIFFSFLSTKQTRSRCQADPDFLGSGFGVVEPKEKPQSSSRVLLGPFWGRFGLGFAPQKSHFSMKVILWRRAQKRQISPKIPCWIFLDFGILGFFPLETTGAPGDSPDLGPETSELSLPRHSQTFPTSISQPILTLSVPGWKLRVCPSPSSPVRLSSAAAPARF